MFQTTNLYFMTVRLVSRVPKDIIFMLRSCAPPPSRSLDNPFLTRKKNNQRTLVPQLLDRRPISLIIFKDNLTTGPLHWSCSWLSWEKRWHSSVGMLCPKKHAHGMQHANTFAGMWFPPISKKNHLWNWFERYLYSAGCVCWMCIMFIVWALFWLSTYLRGMDVITLWQASKT